MSEQPRPEQHRDYYPHDSSQVLEWHERRHEAVHEILTKAGIKGSLTLLVEERVQRLACLHLEAVAKVQRLTSELESAQKMCDHWEKKAAERQGQFEECRTLLGERIELLRETLDEWITIAKKAVAERDELKRQKELVNPVDWERVRIDAAIAAMQGMCASGESFMGPMQMIAVGRADLLVEELQKKTFEKWQKEVQG